MSRNGSTAPGSGEPPAQSPDVAGSHRRASIDLAQDQAWADLLSPMRRQLIIGSGVAAGAVLAAAMVSPLQAASNAATASASTEAGTDLRPLLPAAAEGESPWGYQTASEATGRPPSIRPEGGYGLPDKPRPYTAIHSYHAHIYFDEDSYPKAALIRRWVAERFPVELGNWNPTPRGPHVTPSFYFGFTNELLPLVVPWLQLNSLGLTILLHPNSDDPRADHLHYTLWVNRSQPVNAFNWKRPGEAGAPPIEKIFPNIVPTVRLET